MKLLTPNGETAQFPRALPIVGRDPLLFSYLLATLWRRYNVKASTYDPHPSQLPKFPRRRATLTYMARYSACAAVGIPIAAAITHEWCNNIRARGATKVAKKAGRYCGRSSAPHCWHPCVRRTRGNKFFRCRKSHFNNKRSEQGHVNRAWLHCCTRQHLSFGRRCGFAASNCSSSWPSCCSN